MTKKPMTASEMGKRRWKGVDKAVHAEIARAGAAKTNAIKKAKSDAKKELDKKVVDILSR